MKRERTGNEIVLEMLLYQVGYLMFFSLWLPLSWAVYIWFVSNMALLWWWDILAKHSGPQDN